MTTLDHLRAAWRDTDPDAKAFLAFAYILTGALVVAKLVWGAP